MTFADKNQRPQETPERASGASETKHLSRRGFLTGAVLAGAALGTAGLIGCAPAGTTGETGSTSTADGTPAALAESVSQGIREIPPL